jgi:hypothetical protein
MLKKLSNDVPKPFSPRSSSDVELLFRLCMERQTRIMAPLYAKNLKQLTQELLFGTRLFWPYPIGGWKPFEETFNKADNPLTFSVAQNENDNRSTTEWRYDELLSLLREEADRHRRLLLLARWLKQEGICQPEEFLPRVVLDNLIRRYRKAARFSDANTAHWALVTNWKRYFAALHVDLQEARSTGANPKTFLVERGYYAKAIECALNKRTVQSAALHWTHEQTNISLHTLQNSLSQQSLPKRTEPR